MSSAAKLRNAGRATAVLASAALVVTSFGPTAFAWDAAPAGNTQSDQAGIASFGMVDSDPSEAGTQGAQLVQAGAQNQLAGEMRFVLPNTWKKGDYIDFTVSPAAALPDNATSADYVQWSELPDLAIAAKPYAETTHVHDTSDKTTNSAPSGGAGTAAVGEGSVEDGLAKAWVNPTNGSTDAPIAPTYHLEPLSGTPATTFRLVLDNDSSDIAVTETAKFIGTIRTPKITVGSNVTGQINVTAKPSTTNGALLINDDAGATAATTAIASVAVARLSAQSGGVVADGTSQVVGPIVLEPATGKFTNNVEQVTVTLANGTFDPNVEGKVLWYDAAGTLLNPTATPKPPTSTTTINADAAPAGASKLVLSGFMAQSTNLTMTYSAAAGNDGMTATPVTTFTGVHQTDIEAPNGATEVEVVNTKDALADRMRGATRYQTAASVASKMVDKVAASKDANGNVPNIVLVSGQEEGSTAPYADALSGAYLAAVKNAPILVTPTSGLDPAVQEFIRTNGVKNVYIVGGYGVVSQSIEDQLKAANATDKASVGANAEATTNKIMVTRLRGSDRYATNQVANQFAASVSTNGVGKTTPKFGQSSKRTAILASGETPWDSLAAGSLIGNSDTADNDELPIVLTDQTSSLRANALAQFQSLGIQHALVVGGNAVVQAAVEQGLNDNSVTTNRLKGAAGTGRYGTNRAVIDFAMKGAATATNTTGGLGWSTTKDTVDTILANSGESAPGKLDPTGWADALAVAPLAAEIGGAVVLTPATETNSVVKETVNAYAVPFGPTALVSGGFSRVSDKVVSEVNAIIAK